MVNLFLVMLETLTDAEYNKCKLKKKKKKKKETRKCVFSSFLSFFSVRENSLFVKYPNYDWYTYLVVPFLRETFT